MLSYSSAVEERMAIPEPSSAPDIVLRDADILAWSKAVIPAASPVVSVLSFIVKVCFIEPVCLNPLVFTAAQLTLIFELIIWPDDSLKITPNPLSVILIVSKDMYVFITSIMLIPEGLFPHVPPASPVNEELLILIGSDIPAPAPYASIADLLPSV